MFDFDPAKKVRAYSKGNRQKINLIAAFAAGADLLILDEPTAGLDPLMEQVFRDCVRRAKADGHSVFLSSHILSEVEAVCDRVAILRAGSLVELGTLESMKHLSALSVEAVFDREPPDVSAVPGVRIIEVGERRLRCQVSGPIAPLLDSLSGTGVRELLSREPSLEELFLAHYGQEDDDDVVAA